MFSADNIHVLFSCAHVLSPEQSMFWDRKKGGLIGRLFGVESTEDVNKIIFPCLNGLKIRRCCLYFVKLCEDCHLYF